MILDGIDERLLTKDEQARYRELVWEEQTMRPSTTRRGPLLSWRETVRLRSYWLGMPVYLAVTGGPFVVLVIRDHQSGEPTGSEVLPAVFAILAAVLVGGALLALLARRETRTVVARRVDDYLSSISFASRVRTPIQHGWRSNGGYKSTRQLQHEWYGHHSELTWRDRVMGETLGLDADTYVSNFLEHDKD